MGRNGHNKGNLDNDIYFSSKHKQDKLNNANSAFILTDILISRVCQSGQSGLISQADMRFVQNFTPPVFHGHKFDNANFT